MSIDPSERPTEPLVDRDDLVVSPEPGTPPAGVVPSPPRSGPAVVPASQSVADEAVADLVRRVGGEVEVVLARPETFPDGAVGCRRPDEVVTQATVEGHRVVVRRGERVWLYTAAAGESPRLCPSDAKDGGYAFVPPPGLDD